MIASKNYFEGWYYRHQSLNHTLAIIPGRAKDGAFVQIITDKRSYNIPYPLKQYSLCKGGLYIGNNAFTPGGININILSRELTLHGQLYYSKLTPIHGDIMGPFRFFPMECRHGVISMRHKLSGCVELNGETLDFAEGIGYIESDRGRSFPKSYTWVHANFPRRDCSVMVSVAEIPFMGLSFKGCICVIHLEGREYRLATYNGVKILRCEHNALSLLQKRYRLDISADKKEAYALNAPQSGAMSRVIHETPSCAAHFRFIYDETVLFEGENKQTAYEYA